MIILEELEELEKQLGRDATQLKMTVSGQFRAARSRRCDKRLGEILVEDGHIEPAELDRALREHATVPEIPLGQLLIRSGYVSPFKVYKALGKQFGIDPATYPDVQPIGEQLVEDGVIDREKLEHALRVQREEGSGEMLGRVLVRLGYADLHQIYEALCHQLGRILFHLAGSSPSGRALAEQLDVEQR